MAGNPPTSVILPAYVPNEELLKATHKCLSSLEATASDYQLVVVDNGSIPGASKLLRMVSDLYIRYDQPIGYARAANIGLAVAQHDWLVVLNTDLEFTQEDWLAQLQADYLQTEGGVLSAMDEMSDCPRRANDYGGIWYDWAWFSCWLTHRQVIQRVGYFDESMGYRFHDQDYAIRLTRAGYRVMRDNKVKVKHTDSATYDTMDRDDAAEQALMLKRWGARDFTEWLVLGQPAAA